MRPVPARVLGSIRLMSTSHVRPLDSLAATFGKAARASSRPTVASSSTKAYGGADDDGGATQADSAVGEDSQAADVLPIFKYHGSWGTPRTPGLRHLKMPYSPWLWKGKPFTPLTTAQRKNGGRGGTGRIVRYHIGGGHKRRLRKLDFKRLEEGPQDVVRIEYDPGRSCHIALLRNRTGLGADGGWSYIVAPDGTRAGDVITSYRSGVPRGLVPQWDSEVARSDVAAGAREVAELQIKARRSKYLADGFRALEAGLDQPLRLDDVPAAAAARGDVHDEGSFAAADAVEEPVLPAAADDDAPDVVQVRTRSNSTSSAPASHRSFSTASPAAPSSSSARAFSNTPAARSIEVSATDAPAKAPSIYPAKVAPRWSQATAGIAPSFALNLLRTLIIKPGNVVQLTLIPLNTPIHCISLGHDTHAALCRGAGTSAVIVGHQKPDEKGAVYSLVRLQSGEVRKIASDSFATIGQVSNKYHGQRNLGKAGRSRNLGRRPTVRGLAMNAFEHPHGGGRGKTKSNKHPRSRFGWLTRGVRTRKPGINGHKNGNKMVVKERPRGKAMPATMERKK